MSEINSISIEDGDGRAKQPYDAARAEAAVRELLLALGENPERDGLKRNSGASCTRNGGKLCRSLSIT